MDSNNPSPDVNQSPDHLLPNVDHRPVAEPQPAIQPTVIQPTEPVQPVAAHPFQVVEPVQHIPAQPLQPVQPQPVPFDSPPVAANNPPIMSGLPPVGSAAIVSGTGGLAGSDAGPVVGAVSPLVPPPAPRAKRFKKPLLIGVAASVLLVGSASAYYFGYKVNPSIVLSQSLSNTGKGYSKLVDYVDQQAKTHYAGTVGKGSYTVKSNGVSADGNFNFSSNSGNSDTNFDLGYGTGRLSGEVRTIKSAASATMPSIYIKATGITALGELTGSSQIDSAIKQYDGKWIVVDQSLLSSLGGLASVAGASQPASPTAISQDYPTEAQVIDEARAFGKVSQQYVFTTAKDKSVTEVVKRYGVETVDAHKAYHYKMALNPEHVKQYILAQESALKASTLDAWLKKTNSEADVDSSFQSMADSTKDIKSTDTFDLWADVNTRLVYKIRISDKGSNAASNYVDIGFDYKGGTSYPLFISGQTKASGDSGSGALVFTINSKTHTVGVKLTGKETGSVGADLSANFTFTPTNKVTAIAAPTGAVPLSQVLNQLGLGDLVTSALNSATSSTTDTSVQGGIQSKAQDSKRQSDIAALQTQLEEFFAQNSYYPSLSDMNNPSWLAANMKSMDQNALVDPSNPTQSKTLVAAPTAKSYSYAVTDSRGKSCESNDTTCAEYTLDATLSDGKTTERTNLD